MIDENLESAREIARRYAKLYLGLSDYTNALLRSGFTEQDIADGGSDRLIDAVVPHGDAAAIAAAVSEHLAAGANHVCGRRVPNLWRGPRSSYPGAGGLVPTRSSEPTTLPIRCSVAAHPAAADGRRAGAALGLTVDGREAHSG